MIDFFCAICGKINITLTMFAATFLCKECLAIVKTKAQEQTQHESVSKVIVEQSMEDIYD